MLKGYNDLRTTHPKIAREWNKGRNGDLKPTDAIASSNKRVWWKCKECHELCIVKLSPTKSAL